MFLRYKVLYLRKVKKNKFVIFEIIFSNVFDIIKRVKMMKYRVCNRVFIIIIKLFLLLNF